MTAAEQSKLTELGVAPEKLAVYGLGLDMKLSTGGDGERIRAQHGITGPIVLHLGMKAYEKGSITLIEAMKQLWNSASTASLVMAGPSLRAFDEYVAQNASNLPRFTNLPPFPDEQKRDLLAAADVVVQPSRVESLGLVLLEAWANAKPVIAADIAVSSELVTSCEGGVLVPFGDATVLAQQIVRLLSDDQLRHSMGQRGQAFAQSYAGDKLWPRYAEEFERLAQQ